MPARRFTIACLLATLFGLCLARLAADAGHRPPEIADTLPALFLGKVPAR